jgi:cytochrome oxidase Cu insertion factor (SCO1/SenC/PrrC family)
MLTAFDQKGNMTLERCFLFGGDVMRTLPRGVTLILIGAALTGCVANNANTTRSSSHKPTDAGKTAPEIAGIDADGTKFHLSDYRGKVVLLDFWAVY